MRCFLASVMVAVWCWSFGDSFHKNETQYWFIYWTHWTLSVEVAYLLLAAFATWRFLDSPAGAKEPTPWWVKGTWVLYDVAFPGSFFVMLLYWLLVFTPPVRALSCMSHGAHPTQPQGSVSQRPAGRERMDSPTLQRPQDPILLLPRLCFRGGGFPTFRSPTLVEQQSVATPQATRGWARPPCRHFKIQYC